jgi:magnesium-protoporphyrin O-methyltransferase
VLVFSFPRRNVVSRGFIASQNAFFRLRRREFRTFAHPPEEMIAVLITAGLEPTFRGGGAAWLVAGAER